MEKLIDCDERLPKKAGQYKILNNSGCNNGEGLMDFNPDSGWDVPECIAGFYRVLAWYEVTDDC